MINSFSVSALFVLLVGVFTGAVLTLMFMYFGGAAHGLIAKFKGEEGRDDALPWMAGLWYCFAMFFALGIGAIADKFGPVSMSTSQLTGDELLAVFIPSAVLALVVVVAGTKMTTSIFHYDVRFAHWWSTRVIALGSERPTCLRAWF